MGRRHHLLLLLLLQGTTTTDARAARRTANKKPSSPSDAAKNAREHKLVSVPHLGALDGLPDDNHCKVPILPGGESESFSQRIREFREDYSDAAKWTAGVLKRVRKRQKHAELLRQHKGFTPVKGEGDLEDAAFGTYINQLNLLHEQVKAQAPNKDGMTRLNEWETQLKGTVV